ncbi:hypothetical protein C8R45DRAFT_1027848 [Mycena sanguinolenta]|nr:hypothetical protein C8R45DRAFT_1027848 [Mycena sanguinolenta]
MPSPPSMRRSTRPSASRPAYYETDIGETNSDFHLSLDKALSLSRKFDPSSVTPTVPFQPSRSEPQPTRPLLDLSPKTEMSRDQDLRKVALKRRSLERALSLSLKFETESVAPVPSPTPTPTPAAVSTASSASPSTSSNPIPSASSSPESVSMSAGQPTRPLLVRPALKRSTIVPLASQPSSTISRASSPSPSRSTSASSPSQSNSTLNPNMKPTRPTLTRSTVVPLPSSSPPAVVPIPALTMRPAPNSGYSCTPTAPSHLATQPRFSAPAPRRRLGAKGQEQDLRKVALYRRSLERALIVAVRA